MVHSTPLIEATLKLRDYIRQNLGLTIRSCGKYKAAFEFTISFKNHITPTRTSRILVGGKMVVIMAIVTFSTSHYCCWRNRIQTRSTFLYLERLWKIAGVSANAWRHVVLSLVNKQNSSSWFYTDEFNK